MTKCGSCDAEGQAPRNNQDKMQRAEVCITRDELAGTSRLAWLSQSRSAKKKEKKPANYYSWWPYCCGGAHDRGRPARALDHVHDATSPPCKVPKRTSDNYGHPPTELLTDFGGALNDL
jgi:hypothetical protein